MRSSLKVDVAVIGAGTAGLSAVGEIKKLKRSFVLIDPGPLGTTCARVGCMPSKVLLQAALDFSRIRHFKSCGRREKFALDGRAVLRHVRELRDHFTSGPIHHTRELGSKYLAERAEFLEPGILRAGGCTVRAKSVVLATGSHPIVKPEWSEMDLLTSDSIFEIENLPKSLAVLGLGPLGAELGQAMAQLGVEVHAYNLDKRVLGLTDPELLALAHDALKKDMTLTLGESDVTKAKGKFEVRVRNSVKVDAVLAALGRKPNLKGLGLESIGVKFDERGIPLYNPKTLKLNGHKIFLAGDVRAHASVLHEARNDGRIAGRLAAGGKNERKSQMRFGVCFTHPGAAVVGSAFKDLSSVRTGRVSFSDQGRAKIMGENEGALHVYADKKSGRLLGAEMLCPSAEHLAHLLALAITHKMSARDVLKMPFYHPTLEEGLRTALRSLL